MPEREIRLKAPVIFLVFLLMVGARILYPTSDPPITLSRSNGVFTDPGVYATNARNRVLFGNWGLGDETSILISPLSSFSLYMIFKTLGIGIPQSRVLPICFGLFTTLLFYITLRNVRPREIALLATGLLGLNYTFIMYNRLSMPETPMIFFLLLSLYLLLKHKSLSCFLAGVSLAIALLFKASALFFLPVAMMAILLPNWPRERRSGKILISLLWFIGGAALPLSLYLILFAWPHLKEIGRIHLSAISTRTGGNLLFVLYKMPRIFGYEFFRKIPFVIFFSNLYVLYLLDRLFKRRPQEISELDLLNLTWLLSGYFFLSLWSYYRPQRYFIYLLLPLSLFASEALIRICKGSPDRPERPNIFLCMIFWGASYILAIFARDYFINTQDLPILWRAGIEIVFLLSFLCLTLVAGSLFYSYPQRLRVERRMRAGFVLIAMPLLIQSYQYIDWAMHRTYSLIEISQDLEERLDKGAIAGFWAKALSLENTHRVTFLPQRQPGENEEMILRQRGIAYFLLEEEEGGDMELARRYFFQTLKKAVISREYQIGKSFLRLYELNLGQRGRSID
jgi:4-amino-4-deoxy-L-arabinose transferase-like glycosyltransferase